MLLHPLKGQTPTQCETGPLYDQSLHSKHPKAYIFDQGFQPILELNWLQKLALPTARLSAHKPHWTRVTTSYAQMDKGFH